MKKPKILVLCTGNSCRSQIAKRAGCAKALEKSAKVLVSSENSVLLLIAILYIVNIR
ncbi:hypothetical protein [Leptospira ellisii]|uniref:hypothetical protein n=1 Tax=Leptospira ellisii TaxID=2023197 RepID=UPI001A9CF8CB|nr:hypothetical protein [Leptospira ellisii]